MGKYNHVFPVLFSMVAVIVCRPYNDGLSNEYQQYYKNQYQQYYFPPNSPYNTINREPELDKDVSNVAPNIISQMNDLEKDVSGFHDAMANMAEAMIVSKPSKDGSMVVVEKVKDKDMSKKSYTKKVKAKVKHERNRFEKEMAKFFTNFMCGNDC